MTYNGWLSIFMLAVCLYNVEMAIENHDTFVAPCRVVAAAMWLVFAILNYISHCECSTTSKT